MVFTSPRVGAYPRPEPRAAHQDAIAWRSLLNPHPPEGRATHRSGARRDDALPHVEDPGYRTPVPDANAAGTGTGQSPGSADAASALARTRRVRRRLPLLSAA
ncbi:hypothetical protein Acsp03_51660 [Actinomadura sp. NBRC 104412]|nr:hypothetical protein Acsp03_51660 [Actinomadura sp. NBRC 104412]